MLNTASPEKKCVYMVLFRSLILCSCLWFALTGHAETVIQTGDEVAADSVNASPPAPPSFADHVAALKVRSLAKRGQAMLALTQQENPRTLHVLQALLDNKLLQLRESGDVVIAVDENNASYQIVAAASGTPLDSIERAQAKKIKLNNRLRSKLRVMIGRLQLSSEDADIRLKAIEAMSKKPDAKTLATLRAHANNETDSRILQALKLTFALQDIDSSDQHSRLAAIDVLAEQNNQDALNKLQALNKQDEQGNYLETDTVVRQKARAAQLNMEAKVQIYAVLETVFFGLSLGAVLVLAAIGLTITFGVMGVINMAHGELMMLGAYTTYVMQQILPDHTGLAVLLAVPAAFMISGIVGIGIERGIIRFLYGRPLETLLATFGVSLFLQQTVRSIFSPLNRSVSTPDWMSGSYQVNDFLSFTWNRFYILIFALLVFAMLLQILKRTRLGLEVRSVAQNRNMAKAMGIPTERVDAMTFGLGSGIAGVAGVALSQITNVGPNLGQAYIVDSFMVVVFGGVGNLWGTLVAGFSLGIANKVLEPFAGAVLAKILVLIFIILFIQKRPRGLFPQKGRAAEA